MTSNYSFGILWPLYYLSFHWWLLITPLVSCGHCIICPSIDSFVSCGHCIICPSLMTSVLPFTSNYSFGILWPLYYLSFHWWLLITPLVSCGHCIICPSIDDFWLLLWYLVAIVLSVLPLMTSDYSFGILWPLYYLSFHWWLLITPLVSCGHCIICPSIDDFWLLLWYLVAIVLSVLPLMTSNYSFGILWPLYYLSFHWWLLITPLVSCGHCIICPSIDDF